MPTLYLIDGYAQFFRAYHAIRSPMTSPVTKEPTNMTFGFVGMLLKLLRGEGAASATGRPATHLAVTIDISGDRETFRSEIYPEYKANREPPPEDLFPQVERCLALLRAIGVPIVGAEGFEADDAIATLVTRLRQSEPGLAIRIVSKDKDLKQLLEEDETAPVEMYDIHTDAVISAATLHAETGLRPGQVADMLALMGDNVDNVPGVAGVGPKTAAELIAKFGTLDEVLAHGDEIKGKRGEAIRAAHATLALSRKLVALRHDAPVEMVLEAAETRQLQLAALMPILKELGFNRYQDELAQLMGQPSERVGGTVVAAVPIGATSATSTRRAGRKVEPEPGQGGLFDSHAAVQAGALAVSAAASTFAAGAATRGVYRCVKTKAELDELCKELRAAAMVALDTETTGLSPRECKLCGLSFSTKVGTGWYVPVRSPTPGEHLDEATVLAALGPILAEASRAKCGHNLKFDVLVLRAHGVEVGWPAAERGADFLVFDSMVASYLIDASRSSHGLDALALALLGHTNISIKELIGTGPSQRTFDTVPLDLATEYAAEDADVTLRLYETMAPQLRAMGLDGLFGDVEMPLVAVLAELEWNGIRVDPVELERQRARLTTRIDTLRAAIDAAAKESLGRVFNPDSPKQLAAALFNRPDAEPPGLGIKPLKKTATGHSTDIEVLETLAGDASITTPIPSLIVEFRQLSKLVSTYLVALKEAINPETGRIHASFNQTVAATGRLSSSDPNLQNIPIRTEIGREIRRAFVAEPGCVLVSADYSQIELRILAHLSGDPALIEAFMQDQDIHTAVAAQINKVPLDRVTREQRAGAKMVNFGIVYGVTPFGLARRLGCSNDEAAQIIDAYKRRFSGITTFLHECVAQAKRFGYVETMLKRRRPIPDIESTNPSRRAFAERIAINSVVQGSAADLIKLAMIDLHARLSHSTRAQAGNNQPDRQRGLSPAPGARMLLQIHDELVFEVPMEHADATRALVVERMEAAMQLSVPLKVDSSVAATWFDE